MAVDSRDNRRSVNLPSNKRNVARNLFSDSKRARVARFGKVTFRRKSRAGLRRHRAESVAARFLDGNSSADNFRRLRAVGSPVRVELRFTVDGHGVAKLARRGSQVDVGGVEFSRRRNFHRRLLGVQSSRLGRLLGLGSRRKFVAGTVAVECGVVAFDKPRAEKIGGVGSGSRGGNVHIRACHLRDVPHAFGNFGRLLGSLVRGHVNRNDNRSCKCAGTNRRADDSARQSKITSARQNVRHSRRIGVRDIARLSADNFHRGDCLGRNVNATVEPNCRRSGGSRQRFLHQKHRTDSVGSRSADCLHVRKIRAFNKFRRQNFSRRLFDDVGSDCNFFAGRNRHAGISTTN